MLGIKISPICCGQNPFTIYQICNLQMTLRNRLLAHLWISRHCFDGMFMICKTHWTRHVHRGHLEHEETFVPTDNRLSIMIPLLSILLAIPNPFDSGIQIPTSMHAIPTTSAAQGPQSHHTRPCNNSNSILYNTACSNYTENPFFNTIRPRPLSSHKSFQRL